MLKHNYNTRTRYEYAISDGDKIAFTLWFMERNPSLQKVYRLVQANYDGIKRATNAAEVIWNGDKTITAGKFTGRFTGKTLLQARGCNEESYHI
jgi:hypothetical protein